MSYTINT